MRVAPEGWPFIAIAWALVAAGAFAATHGHGAWGWPVTVILAIVAAWVVYFFRDPVRSGPRGDRLVVSPADGKIVDVREVDERDYLKARAIRISVFMNIFSVHVNRYATSGTVEYLHYNKGLFLHAAAEKASLENEQSSVGVASPVGRVLMRQIAGLIARRIVTDPAIGDAATQGERFGIIRFGSRVDVFVPADCAVKVRRGEQVYAGVTVLAERA